MFQSYRLSLRRQRYWTPETGENGTGGGAVLVSEEKPGRMKRSKGYEPASLRTERLILRPITEGEGKLLRELFSDPDVTKYLPWGHPYSDSETERRLQELLSHWNRSHFGTYAIRQKADRRAIGYAGLETVEHTPFVELLYAISPSCRGKGLASEAAEACIEYGFYSLGLDLIVGVVAPENRASGRVLQKLGMRPASGMDFYGSRLLYYSLSREEYAASLNAIHKKR